MKQRNNNDYSEVASRELIKDELAARKEKIINNLILIIVLLAVVFVPIAVYILNLFNPAIGGLILVPFGLLGFLRIMQKWSPKIK